MFEKRITVFMGHYGSGKTNIAVNYAIKLASEGKKVCIADLDIVNPYFRTKDSEEELRAHGIDLIYSDYEPVVYPQVGKRSAINMCVIDYVMNCGFVLPQEWKRNAYDRKEETK